MKYRIVSDVSVLLLILSFCIFYQSEFMAVHNDEILSLWIIFFIPAFYFVLKGLQLLFRKEFTLSNIYYNFILLSFFPLMLLKVGGSKAAMIGIAIPLVLLTYFFWRRHSESWMTLSLKQLSLSLITLVLSAYFYQLTSYQIQNARTVLLSDDIAVEDLKPEQLPDIYFILLDAQTSLNSLEKFWGYKDTSIITAYEDLGFEEVRNAECVYDKTPLSLASTLNMSLLNQLKQTSETEYFKKVIPCIRTSAVVRQFKSLGYRIFNYSIFDIAENKAYYKYGLQVGYRSFLKVAMENNLYSIVINRLFFRKDISRLKKIYGSLPNDHNRVFEALDNMATDPGEKPNFVYAHFMLPHHPYYQDAKGRLIEDPESIFPSSEELKKKMYLQQFEYVHHKLISIFEKMDTVKPSIIVIQGDHGFRELEDQTSDAEERYSVLYLVRSQGLLNFTPDSSGMTVNTFRVLLNDYFGADLVYYQKNQMTN